MTQYLLTVVGNWHEEALKIVHYMILISQNMFSIFEINYTGSLAPADFSGAVFTCAHFQKVAQISSLCDLHYISQGNSFTHAFLVTNDLSAADLVHADFCQT